MDHTAGTSPCYSPTGVDDTSSSSTDQEEEDDDDDNDFYVSGNPQETDDDDDDDVDAHRLERNLQTLRSLYRSLGSTERESLQTSISTLIAETRRNHQRRKKMITGAAGHKVVR